MVKCIDLETTLLILESRILLKLESLKANFIRIIVALYAYQLFTGSVVDAIFYVISGGNLLITGLVELQEDRKGGFLGCFVVSLFLFVVSILGILMD
ncbi:DUF3953 domain-containing protein [Peribacillus frigoritolerans]|uniref:DUF3953 domain-containing protein n=1 Tax=Peribacillus frigoritolerans TaxID=450367 RepID=UPI003518A83F